MAVASPRNSLYVERPACHSYCYLLIQLFVNLVLHGPTSLRGASGVLAIFAPHLFLEEHATPSPNCGTLWLLRLGLYELTRPLEQADDWVWIVDHTVQIGTVKCLLIVGVRLAVWQQLERPLAHQDLTLIALEPAESTKSALVKEEFEKAAQRTGVPRAILSDGAAALKRATEDFRMTHTATANLYDMTHKIALFLKRELEHDPRWKDFIKRSGTARSELMFDPLAYLAAPTLKHKARYMNLSEMVTWAVKTRRFLDAPVSPDGQPVNLGKLNITLGWLREYDEAITDWEHLLRAAEAGLEYLRGHGYHSQAAAELTVVLEPLATRPASRRLADSLLEFVVEQSSRADPDERLPASSEVIESLIGRGKRLEGQQSASGFTKMVLGMAAAVTRPTQEFIQQAFQAVKTHHVTEWAKQKIGISLQSRRRAAFGSPTHGTKTAQKACQAPRSGPDG